MFCPQCRLEYRDEYTRCSDCDVPLVAALPEESPAGNPAPLDLVTVLEVSDPAILAVAQSLLAEGGFEFVTDREELHSIFGWGNAAHAILGDLKIEVPAARAAEARELLAQLEEPSSHPEGEEEPAAPAAEP